MKLEREEMLLGFREPHMPTYCYTVLPGVPKPRVWAYQVCAFGITGTNSVIESLRFLH